MKKKIPHFCFADNMSIYPKQCRKLKLSVENWNWGRKVEIKLIDSKVAKVQRNKMTDKGESNDIFNLEFEGEC